MANRGVECKTQEKIGTKKDCRGITLLALLLAQECRRICCKAGRLGGLRGWEAGVI